MAWILRRFPEIGPGEDDFGKIIDAAPDSDLSLAGRETLPWHGGLSYNELENGNRAKAIYTVGCSGAKIKRPLLPLVQDANETGMNLKEDLFWSNEIRWGTPMDLTNFTSPIPVDRWNLRDYQRQREEERPDKHPRCSKTRTNKDADPRKVEEIVDQPAKVTSSKGLEKLKARFLELNGIRDQMEQ
ncbi:hypothetical protein BY996DRAFT_6580547 [Phakopsora pachyrhizi]|nr:hypothetical protein BY996DRAFT_6580547 [Phakopsora pachyrhizi]